MNQLMQVTQYLFFALLAVLIFACGGSKVETNRIDCELDKVSITHDLKGTVSSSGDIVTGTITIKCDDVALTGVTITGSAGWWNIGSVGPSVNGVITVQKAAESLGHSDIGTSKTIDIIVLAYENGSESSRVFPISIPIS